MSASVLWDYTFINNYNAVNSTRARTLLYILYKNNQQQPLG